MVTVGVKELINCAVA